MRSGDYIIRQAASRTSPPTRPRRASGSSSATPRTTSSTRRPATRPVGSSTACSTSPRDAATEATAFYIDRNGFPQARSGSGAAYVKIVRSEQGFDREIRYFDIKGNPQLDENGVFGESPGDRSEDRPRRRFHQPGPRREGARCSARTAIARFAGSPTIDAATMIEAGLLRRAGRPTRHKDGFAKLTAKYDERGNQIEDGLLRRARPAHPAQGRLRQVHRPSYDERGNRTEWAYFDEAGQPTRHKDGYARFTAQLRRAGQPDRGGLLRRARPAHPAQGRLRQALPSTTSGATRPSRPTSTSTAGPPGTRTATPGWTAKYDERGNQTEEAYFDEPGRPTRHKDGYARLTAEYDERGNLTEWAYFDEHGRPARHKDGYARLTARYDERGNQTEWAYFDEHGRPTRHKDGYARLDRQLRRAGQSDRGGLLRRARPAHPAQGRLRQAHRPLRRAGQPDRGGLLRRARPAHPAQGRLRQVHRPLRRAGQPVPRMGLLRRGRPAHPAQGRLRQVHRPLRRAGQPDRGGLLRRARPAHPAQGRLRQAHRPLRRAGQPDRGGLLRRGRPAHPAQGRLRPAGQEVRRAGQLDRGWPTSTRPAGPSATRTAT